MEGLTFKPKIRKRPKQKQVTVDLFGYKKKAKHQVEEEAIRHGMGE